MRPPPHLWKPHAEPAPATQSRGSGSRRWVLLRAAPSDHSLGSLGSARGLDFGGWAAGRTPEEPAQRPPQAQRTQGLAGTSCLFLVSVRHGH